MEGLNIALKDTVGSGLIHGTKVGDTNLTILHLFYVDDVIIVSEWNRQDIENIIRVMQVFYLASGLKINISKVYEIRFYSEEIEDMVRVTGCASSSLPFVYLGLSIGSNMNLVANWQFMINHFCRKLSTWKANMLWRSVTISDSLWARVVKAIHGDDTGMELKGYNSSGTWANIVDSFSMLHSKDIIPLHTLRHKVGNGSSIRFWKDNWIGNGPLSTRYNRLFHLDANPNCMLADRVSDDTWTWNWNWSGNGPLSMRYNWLFHLDENLNCMLADRLFDDTWTWNWKRQRLGSRNEESLEILKTEIGHVQVNDCPDSWHWNDADDGVFSVNMTRLHVDNCFLSSLSPSTRWSKILPRKIFIMLLLVMDVRVYLFFVLSVRNSFSLTSMENENPIRILRDYSKPSHEGYQNTIELHVGNNVVPLGSDTIRLVQNRCSFHRLQSKDPNQHFKDFLKLVDSLDLDVTNKERARLRLFQFSLRDQASNWLEHLLEGSISTWEDLTTRFLAQFFLPGRPQNSAMTS
ncbi:putative RNA-directed DNA polymerase, eukaryota, reverse transcriptase zinc-binding domain protein [Tanacetum coccineum]